METGPWLKVSSDRLVKEGIEPVTPGLQGQRFIHYTTAAPILNGLTLSMIFPQVKRKKNFKLKIVNIFLPISFNICFGCSKEPSH